MKKVSLLILGLVLVLVGCEKKSLDRPVDAKNILARLDSANLKRYSAVPDTITVRIGDVPSSIAFIAPPKLPPKMKTMSIDTASTPVRTTPDFTDAGVGMLLSNAGNTDPSILSDCIYPALKSWLEAVGSGSSTATLMLPDPDYPAESCSTGVMVEWEATIGQTCSWARSSSTTATALANAIRGYQNTLALEGYFFPCTVIGLDYGRSVCAPYSKVQIQRLRDSSGKMIEYRIVIVTY
jgi:hypothetical protein